MSHGPQPTVPGRSTSRQARKLTATNAIALSFLGILLLAGTVLLWPQWRHNPDLSHGWFTPLLFFLLLHESRSKDTQRFAHATGWFCAAAVLIAVAGLALMGVGCLYMAALGATHALVAIVFTTALCTLLTAAWLVFASNNQRLLPLNWTAAVAVLLWMLSAPLPPGTYARLTAGLQLWVTEVVLSLLHLFGIAAVRMGNIIQLANTAVGVEEACSGVRSLLSCVYAGLFFSAVLVRRPWRRAAIVLLSAPLALAMNVARSLLLTLLANKGVDISGAWHDVTGFGILAITAAVLAGLATILARNEVQPGLGATASPPPAGVTSLTHIVLTTVLGLAVVLWGAVLFYPRIAPVSERAAAPDLTALMPQQHPGWSVTAPADLYRFSEQLHTSHLVQRTYSMSTAKGVFQLTVYVAYWSAGDAPVSLVAAHTPDACWPGAGWNALPSPTAAELRLGGRVLAGGQHRLFEQDGYPQHVWYWHLFNGRPIESVNVRSPRELLKLAWLYGFRRDGPQVFVRVSSNRPWEDLAAEPLTQEIFARLAQFGF